MAELRSIIRVVVAATFTLAAACQVVSEDLPTTTVTKDSGADGPKSDSKVPPTDQPIVTCLSPDLPRLAPDKPCGCDADCSTGTCREGVCCSGDACGGKRAAGLTCNTADQCQSGYCVDGVCCNVACTGACVSCKEADNMGQCVPVDDGEKDPHGLCRVDSQDTCGQSGLCNGEGGCAKHV